MKNILLALVLTCASMFAATAPGTILHIVTVKWKADATAQQQQAVVEGIAKMAAQIPGIRNYWVKKVKVQPADFSTVFAIEFENKAAFDAYTNHPAHTAWEKTYLPIREESQTSDVTN